MKRAIGYLRVSTGGQAENGSSLSSQRREVKRFAKEHGYELIEIVSESKSGAVQEGAIFSFEHRPGLSGIIERAGDFDYLIVRDFDRLSRDKLTFAYLLRLFAQHDVEVISVAGESATADTDEGALLNGIMGGLADYERKKILRRLREGKAEKKRQGRHVHGRVPYGYRSEGGILSPNPELVSLVKRIFDECRLDNRTPGKIARGLNKDGIPAPQGATWNEAGVRVILRNAVYAGERYGKKRAHEAIVSRRVWNEAQRALDARRRS